MFDFLKETDMIGCKATKTSMDPIEDINSWLEGWYISPIVNPILTLLAVNLFSVLSPRMSHRSDTTDIQIHEGYLRKRPIF